MPFLYRGRVKVPFEAQPQLIGILMEDRGKEDAAAGIRGALERLKVKLVPLPPQIERHNVRVVRLPASARPAEAAELQKRLLVIRGVQAAGPVVRLDEESASFLTDELIIRFSANLPEVRVREIAAKHDLELLRQFQVAPNTFLARSRKGASYDLLQQCEDLVQTGVVEYAEPNLVSTPVDDAVVPTDNLFGQQWHHAIVRTPDAWQTLRNRRGTNRTFGDANLIIAVVDSGVNAAHPEFNGSVTSGFAKMFFSFNFQNMAANANTSGNHGTCCAGIAAAMANNPSSVAGQNEGVAGAAGNCRILGILRGGTEARYADMYMWAAGFDPGSTTPGFPAQLAQGADIITNSFGFSVGMPISGLMANTFDFLTNNGRGGRGTLLFFSVGNVVPPQDFTTYRPWAAYNRTIAVGASSIGNDGVTEIIADYSNFGGPVPGGAIVDVIAPSHDSYVGGGAVHNPPVNYATITTDIAGQGNLAGAAGNMDYMNGFGGTSSATPLVAGIAALILTANNSLTWIQVREILRNTANKLNFTNTDPIAQYVDTDGDGVADYSRLYGYGRVDAYAAVMAALPPKRFLKEVLDHKPLVSEVGGFEEVKPFKDRIEEVKMSGYDKIAAYENPIEQFDPVFDPPWFQRLEERLQKIEAALQGNGRAFIRSAERPAVADHVARKARTRKR
jgi:subtilisin family serine protease